MTLPKNLTIITSFLCTSKKVDIFLQKTYIFWQICELLNTKPERDTNVLNIRHSEVSSLFPQVSWSKISYVSKNKRVAKHKLHFLIYVVFFFREFPNPIFLFPFISLKSYITNEQFVFSEFILPKKDIFTNGDETCRWTLLVLADYCCFLFKWEHW